MKKNDTKEFIESLQNSIKDEMVKNLLIDAFEQILEEIYRDDEVIYDYFDDDGKVKHKTVLSKIHSFMTEEEGMVEPY